MNLAEEAFKELFPSRTESRTFYISYSGKFRKFNANVKYDSYKIHFHLSRDWLEFSEELRKGILQHLMTKMYKYSYEKTMSIDLYEKFLSNLNRYSKVEKTDAILEESFNRINKKYFQGEISKPNLVWGEDAFRKLGHYEITTHTILISNIFRNEPEFLDYIMYHEMLHIKHKAKRNDSGRITHHTRAFKEEEKLFEDKEIEKKLTWFLRKKKVKSLFGF